MSSWEKKVLNNVTRSITFGNGYLCPYFPSLQPNSTMEHCTQLSRKVNMVFHKDGEDFFIDSILTFTACSKPPKLVRLNAFRMNIDLHWLCITYKKCEVYCITKKIISIRRSWFNPNISLFVPFVTYFYALNNCQINANYLPTTILVSVCHHPTNNIDLIQ